MHDVFYNKHYIRVKNGILVKGFSDAFEQPLDTDICVNEKGGRQFEIGKVINPPVVNGNGVHLYRYDGSLRKATEKEMAEEWEIIKPKPVITNEELMLELLADHEYRICEMELM